MQPGRGVDDRRIRQLQKQDRARVKLLVDVLSADGLSVWWNVDLEGGAAWRQQIQHNLDAAKCAIVVWSATSVGAAGHFVQDEAARANCMRRSAMRLCCRAAMRPRAANMRWNL